MYQEVGLGHASSTSRADSVFARQPFPSCRFSDSLFRLFLRLTIIPSQSHKEDALRAAIQLRQDRVGSLHNKHGYTGGEHCYGGDRHHGPSQG
jgi:hypothetical protein